MKKISLCVSNNLVYDQRMHRICYSLKHAGFQVELIGRTWKDPREHNEFKFNTHRIKCFFKKKVFFYAEFNIRLFFYLITSSFDIICANDSDTLPACWLASIIKRKTLVFDAHEYFTEVPELENRQFVGKTWDIINKICIRKTKLCYTVSNSLANELSQRYNKTFKVIRNLPWKEKYENAEKLKSGELFILYQGAINKGRGLEILIEAMKEIELKLIVAGDGDISEKLKNYVKQNKLESKIVFTGYLLPEEMKKLTKQAFLGYNLLDPRSKSYYYSLSNKFFSYMHAGVPSLSNKFPEYQQIVNEFPVGLLIDFNKESIIGAVNTLLKDETLYKNLRYECLRASQKYCWQNEEKTLIELYGAL